MTVLKRVFCGAGRLHVCILAVMLMPCFAFASDEGGFSWPIDCIPGISCAGRHFRIGYPDVNSTGQSSSCSAPGYTGHQGTDILISSVEQNVAVLSAADGLVRWAQDNLFDHCPDSTRTECSEESKTILRSLQNREIGSLGFNAGNYVIIEHTIGAVRYLTLYAHLAKGSLLTFPGQQVSRGQKIALVGSSGNSQMPHLHFGVYREDGALYRPVDPWKGPCNSSSDGLWAFDPPYQPEIESALISRSFKMPTGASAMP